MEEPTKAPIPNGKAICDLLTSKALTEDRGEKALQEAIGRFEGKYRKFVEKHKQYAVEVNVDRAVARALKAEDVHESAQVFRHELSSIIEARNLKDTDKSKKWIAKWEKFVKLVYPMVKVSLQIVEKLGEVRHLNFMRESLTT
jgi:hypothetical protein